MLAAVSVNALITAWYEAVWQDFAGYETCNLFVPTTVASSYEWWMSKWPFQQHVKLGTKCSQITRAHVRHKKPLEQSVFVVWTSRLLIESFQFLKACLTQGFPQGCPQNRCEIFRLGHSVQCSQYLQALAKDSTQNKTHVFISHLARNNKWKTKWNNTETIFICTGEYTMTADYCTY